MPAIICAAESRICDPGFGAEGAGFFAQYAQLLAQGNNLKAEVVAGTEKRAEATEKADEK
jgi:hypothetical protein